MLVTSVFFDVRNLGLDFRGLLALSLFISLCDFWFVAQKHCLLPFLLFIQRHILVFPTPALGSLLIFTTGLRFLLKRNGAAHLQCWVLGKETSSLDHWETVSQGSLARGSKMLPSSCLPVWYVTLPFP